MSKVVSDKNAELKNKASELPLRPGVYIMKNADGKVIYVGKSRVLRNRVTQYFAQAGRHEAKTEKMVSCVCDFEYILTDTEMEALSLENRLIKLYKPKFNIKLKDDKNYPYIKIDMSSEYPKMSVTRRRGADKAKYFGPYSSTVTAYDLMRMISRYFGIADCKRKFPDDIGKARPCIRYQMGQCCGVCAGKVSADEYRELFTDAARFINGAFHDVRRTLEEKMLEASSAMRYEEAAQYRDRINALESLRRRQKVVSSPDSERDVIAFYCDDLCSCLSVLSIRNGALCDSRHYEFPGEQLADASSLVSFLADFYLKCEYIPKEILLDFKPDEEDAGMLENFLCETAGYTVRLKVPERGELKALCTMAYDNAKQHALHYENETEKNGNVLVDLCRLLSLEVLPEKIEAYDISNFGDDNITAGRICVSNGKFDKSGYRIYNIKGSGTQDDYASMKEALSRRLSHSEDPYPDLILLDGGKGHVSVIKELFSETGTEIPVFGMVKDDYHKTRALTDGEYEISIAKEQAVFMFIYKIQEEVHRFSISTMKRAKTKKMLSSALEKIDGIGPHKAEILMDHFVTVNALKSASAEEIASLRGMGKRDAERIKDYFERKK